MLKDIFGSLGFVIVGSDILFWAYFFIMDKVSVFESSDFGELRIIVDPKGDVWFVASDVAKSLGYINAKDAVKRHVDDDDSMLLQVSDNQWGVKRSILKTRYIDSIRIINESGLYSLILSSKLESAKRFKKWITSEVLPSIRKTGEYKTSSGGKGILVPDFSNQAAASYIFRSSFVSEDQARKAIVRVGNNATKILVKTFRGKLFKKAFERARRGKDISSFERQEKESGFNFLHNPNNGRMQSGHIVIDGIGLFKQIIHER